MKVKELEKTVNLAWSPKSQYPMRIAAGTAAQQVDASFSTNAALELYNVNLGDSSLDLELCCSSPSKNRFHKLIWGPYESGNETGGGVIVGGCDAGQLVIYNAAQLLNNETGIVACTERHSGPVRALDFNSFQKNLLASGASESEIFIWDLNNLTTPMTPGAVSQPTDDIISLSWNKQVQHILATTFPVRCTVWDLRKNEPIIKLTDSSSKIKWKVVVWNPQVATQLCLASEEDACPIIQLWDLRFATTPIRIFEGHQKGILSAAWCDEDPDLLISCGKDNKMLVWNLHPDPPKGEPIVLCDMPLSTQWNFEVNWCPRNPFLVSTSSFDSRATIYSLSGGQPATPTSNKIADSFPGMNHYPQSLPLQQVHHQQQQPVELLKPPKWIKRPCGVSFGFGGKLLSFNCTERTVYVSQVVTEPDLMMKFKELLDDMEQNNLSNHCYKKAETAVDPQVKEIWNFIACQFYGESFRNQVCAFLGITPTALKEKLTHLNINFDENGSNDFSTNVSRIGPADADPFNNSNYQQDPSVNTNGTNDFQILKKPFSISDEINLDRAVCEALLLDNKDIAVDLLIKQNKMADAIILALSGGPELLAKAQTKYFEKSEDSVTTLVSAVVNQDWCNIVETCNLANWKEVLIALLHHTKDNDFRSLCDLLGQRLLVEGDSSQKKSALLCYVCSGDVNELLNNWNATSSSSLFDIQELVELGLIMKEAVKSRGINVSVSGALAKVLVQYAELLASQGYLTAAYTYLGEASDEESITMLKDRLAYVLGIAGASYANRSAVSAPKHNNYHSSQMLPPQNQHPYQTPAASFPPSGSNLNNVMQPVPKPPVKQVHPQPTINKPQPIKAFNAQTLQSPQPLPQQPHIAQVPPSMSFSSNQFNSFQPPPVVNQPTAMYPSTANFFQPLTPSGPSPLAVPPPATSQVGPPPLQSTFTPSTNSHFSQFKPPTVGPPTPSVVAPSPGLPSLPRSTPTPPAPPLSSQMPYNNARQTPDHLSGQNRNKHVLDPSVRGGSGQRSSFSNNFQPLPHIGNSHGNQMPVNSVPPFSSHNDSSFYDFNQQSSTFAAAQANPNTSYIPNPPNPVPSIMQPNMPSMPQPPQKMAHHVTAGWNDPPPVMFEKPILPPQQASTGMASHVSTPYQNNRASATAEPQQKQNIILPEQHMHLQTVLNELQNKCVNKTGNPQMKRKLDDVVRKLEMLYEAVRDNKLSPQTLAGLHEIINAIQRGDYQACLALHTQLVNSSDFAVIASFMPGIKVLVQSALQLDVYI